MLKQNMGPSQFIKKSFFTICISAACLFTYLGSSHAGELTDIERALSHPERPSHDLRLDKVRKAKKVLEFFQIEKGMNVIDTFSGPGYYTEILSYLVGNKGSVVMHNHSLWEAYSKKGSDARIKDNRLPNVYQEMQDLNTTKFRRNHYDVATVILGIHDMYLPSEKSESGEAINPNAFFSSLFDAIKPGGVVGVIEHEAKKGSDPVKSSALHRTDSELIIRLLEEVGFKLEAQSSMLRNYQDDYTLSVFDKNIRWKTDRSVMRFRKPE